MNNKDNMYIDIISKIIMFKKDIHEAHITQNSTIKRLKAALGKIVLDVKCEYIKFINM